MEGSSMVHLFRKYGLGRAITSGLRNFETLMSAVGTWHQSVWELKRFTRSSDLEPMRAVVVDYGFSNCKTPQERIDLRRVFTEFFARGGDEMALHEACVTGQLAPFLESELGKKLPFPSQLLLNSYPLEGCGYMGMVVENAILCRESIYEETKKLQIDSGEKAVILTIPDEHASDEHSQRFLQERAMFLGRGIGVRTLQCSSRETFRLMSFE